MFKILRFELGRAFWNRAFLASLLIGAAIALLHVVQDVLPMVGYNQNFLNNHPEVLPHSIHNKWIGATGYTFGSSLFYSILPILAALPYAKSYAADCKGGYVKNLFIRTEKWKYYVSKYIAVFLTGGTAVTIPLLFNLYLTALCVPAIVPIASAGTFPLFPTSFAGHLYYSWPFIYLIIYFSITFVVSGVLATVALGFGTVIKNQYVVMLTPFFCYLVCAYIATFISCDSLDIMSWIAPNQSIALNPPIAIIEVACLAIIPGFFFFKSSKNEEIY